AVFGQVAARLAHQPDRRVVSGKAQAGAQEGVVLKGCETHAAIVAGWPIPAGPYDRRTPAKSSAMSNPFEQARDFFMDGVRLHEAGRFEEAERQFLASLALVPGRASTLANLGATRLKLGKAAQALEALDQALAQDADAADALKHRAAAL